MIWTPEEKRALDLKRLARMIAERERLDVAIVELTRKLEVK